MICQTSCFIKIPCTTKVTFLNKKFANFYLDFSDGETKPMRLIKNNKIRPISYIDRDRVASKLEQRNISKNCVDLIENGVQNYMRGIISDLYSVFEMMQNNNDSYRKKMFNFYDKEMIKKTKEESEFSKIVINDPLSEYRNFERSDSEQEKALESRFSQKEPKGDEDDKSV